MSERFETIGASYCPITWERPGYRFGDDSDEFNNPMAAIFDDVNDGMLSDYAFILGDSNATALVIEGAIDELDAVAQKLGQWVINMRRDSDETTLTMDIALRFIWEGKDGFAGFSRTYCLNELAHYGQLLAELTAGTVSPIHVIGRGYKSPKRESYAWIAGRVIALTEAINTDGHSLSLNQQNAAIYVAQSREDQQ